MGLLLASLEVNGLNAEKLQELDLDLSRDPDDENAKPLCPRERTATVDRDALFANLSGTSAETEASAAALAGLAEDNDRYVKNGGSYTLEVQVLFEWNSSIIASAYDAEIGRVAQVIRENGAVRMSVEGHTDSTGEPLYNQWLSERRAEVVRRMLLDEHGIPAEQVVALGHGEDKPIADNATREGRAANRRVEFVMDVAPATE
jgi:outer membrane protein OmpA-like peptidoglycan-associated protein